jgi:hypothetical protein
MERLDGPIRPTRGSQVNTAVPRGSDDPEAQSGTSAKHNNAGTSTSNVRTVCRANQVLITDSFPSLMSPSTNRAICLRS